MTTRSAVGTLGSQREKDSAAAKSSFQVAPLKGLIGQAVQREQYRAAYYVIVLVGFHGHKGLCKETPVRNTLSI